MAAQTGGSIIWNLDVDNSKLSKGLSDARNEAKNTADEINKSFDGVKDSSKSAAESFKDFADSAVIGATAITGALGLIGKSALDSASNFQVARISFNTMIGDTKLAGEELAKLSDFAAKTPFTLPEVLQGAKQLMAMGSATEDLIPELKAMGDVSAGLDVPMSRLIQNFGQVRTAGKLTGRELRDFNMAGVPLIDELVKQFNAQGGVLQKVGATSTKTKAKLDSLNDTLAKQSNRMDELNKKGNKESASYKNLAIDIQNTRDKLASLGPASDGVSKRVKVTKKDIADMVSNGDITFDMVKKAFMSMTGEGGKFNNLMDELSKTFSGRLSNISDNFTRLGAALMGVTTSGEVLAGGLFDRISTGAQKVLDVLNQVTPQAQGFMQTLLNNGPAVSAIIGGLVGLITPLAIAFAALVAPALAFAAAGAAIGFAFTSLIQYFGGFQAVQTSLITGFNTIVTVMQPLINFFGVIGRILIGTLTPAWNNLSAAFQTSLPFWQNFIDQIGPLLINVISILAVTVGVLIVAFAGLVAGIMEAFSVAMPYIADAMSRIAETIRGFTDIIVGIFTLNWGKVWQGTKELFEGIFMLIGDITVGILALIAGFVKGIVDFFMNLYDVLVGHSIVPDMVNEIVRWFAEMPDRVFSILSGFMNQVKDWGERIARSFVDGFSKLGDWMKEKVQAALDKAKGVMEGHSPPKEGPFKHIDTWGFNVGKAWVDGIHEAIGGFSMASVPLTTSLQEPRDRGIVSRGNQGGGFGSQQIVVNIGTVQSQQDVDLITREIGFRAALLPAT